MPNPVKKGKYPRRAAPVVAPIIPSSEEEYFVKQKFLLNIRQVI